MTKDRSKTEAGGFEQHRYVPPADSVEIVLVRHGASEAALPGKNFPLIDGQGDPALPTLARRRHARSRRSWPTSASRACSSRA